MSFRDVIFRQNGTAFILSTEEIMVYMHHFQKKDL